MRTMPFESLFPAPDRLNGVTAEFVGPEIAATLKLSDTTSSCNVLLRIEQLVRRYCVLPETAYLPVTLWILATHMADSFEAFPYIALLSPVKRCGKTRMLEIFQLLCANAFLTTAITPAVLFRKMASCPTLLLDESEQLNSRNPSTVQMDILSILNAGHRKSGVVSRCTGSSNNHQVQDFPVYGPKAFAAIGDLPDTLADRSICIKMHRKAPEQCHDAFLRSRVEASVTPLVDEIRSLAMRQADTVRNTYLEMQPPPFLGDREADIWMPLLALCAVTAPKRISELKECCQDLCAAKAEDDVDSVPSQLLHDVHSIWSREDRSLSTTRILGRLNGIEDGRWRALSSIELASYLRPFGIKPRQLQPENRKGYLRADLEKALVRYFPNLAN